MLVLQTLGVAAIRVGTRTVLPTTARAFAALLYLGLERDRRIPRSELQAFIFPGQDVRAGRHGLRQLLYRLKGLGAPIEARPDSVLIPASAVQDDYSELGTNPALASETVRAVSDGVLPGYVPTFSRPLSRWVEEQRTSIESSVLRALVARLGALRAAGHWRELEPIARTSLKLDPLNEEATLALAETLALNGQKAAAMQLLDTYLDEVAPYGKAVRLPASVLRMRISERASDDAFRRARSGPFVGRDAEMAELWRHYKAASRGEPRAIVIHGAPGIGKTRLATEFLKATTLDDATCVKVQCAGHDVHRPLGVFVDLVPKLLASPGGLGVAPNALEQLQRLTQPALAPDEALLDADPRHLFNAIVTAIGDLIDSVCEEQPVVVVVDDAHHMDPASADLAFTLVGDGQPRQLMFVLTSQSKLGAGGEPRAHDGLSWLSLRPLDHEASRELLLSLGQPSTDDGPVEGATDRLALAAGNPLYLRYLVLESPGTGELALPASLTDLLSRRVQRLADTTLRAFVAAVLLGKHCRLDRLVRLAGLNEHELLNGIQGLENEGFLEADGSDIRSAHPMLSQAALALFPPVTMRLMHSTAAMQLQAEAAPGHDVGMLWDAAEHWHRAGATDKAIELLRSCAASCVHIGRPAEACRLLTRALDICPSSNTTDLLQQLISSARVAEDYALALHALATYRSQTSRGRHTMTHDDLELFEMEAKRHSGTSLLTSIPHLLECVRAIGSPPLHRLKAACQLMAAYDLALDISGAVTSYTLMAQNLAAGPGLELHRHRFNLLYHTFAGDHSDANMAAEGLIALAPRSRPIVAAVRALADAALGLFRCGACDRAISTVSTTFELSREHGMFYSMLDTSSVLTWMLHVLGDESSSQHWEATADHLYSKRPAALGRTSHYLSNKIEFALERQRPDEAQTWMGIAERDYADISAPRSRILANAYRLRVMQLGGSRHRPTADLEELARDHATGSRCGLHDNFVEAYWHELSFAGKPDDADCMLHTYVTRERRDGSPPIPALKNLLRERGL